MSATRLRLVVALSTLLVASTFAASTPAHAGVPDLTVVEQGGATMYAPEGWQVQVDAASGVVFMQEDPTAKDSPSIAGIQAPDRA